MKFLFDIAVVHTLFYFIWTYAFTLPIVGIAALLKINTWGMRLSKGLGAIVFSTLSSITVLGHQSGTGTLILYSFLAGILLIFNLVSGSAEARKNVRQDFSWESMQVEKELEHDYVYWLIAIAFFILTLFIPIIGANPINRLFIFLMDWIMDIKIVNWIVIGLSIMLLIGFIWKGFFGVMMFLALRRNSDDEE